MPTGDAPAIPRYRDRPLRGSEIMFPWLWFYAPQFQFPFSGSVAQRIEPDTQWFFAGIPAAAGNGDVEKEAFDIASYGRQLGLISEVLLSMTASDTVSAAQGEESLDRLKKIYRDVEDVKRRHRGRDFDTATDALSKLQASDPAALSLLLQRFAASGQDQQQRRLSPPVRG
jgi:hypothetical protein